MLQPQSWRSLAVLQSQVRFNLRPVSDHAKHSVKSRNGLDIKTEIEFGKALRPH
jgi:hypothetical protein